MIGLFYQMVTALATHTNRSCGRHGSHYSQEDYCQQFPCKITRHTRSHYLLWGGGGLTGVPVCNMASKLMKHNYIAQMSLKHESTLREFKLNIVMRDFVHFSHLSRWILSCGIMPRKLQTPDTLCIASPRMGDESHKNKRSQYSYIIQL